MSTYICMYICMYIYLYIETQKKHIRLNVSAKAFISMTFQMFRPGFGNQIVNGSIHIDFEFQKRYTTIA